MIFFSFHHNSVFFTPLDLPAFEPVYPPNPTVCFGSHSSVLSVPVQKAAHHHHDQNALIFFGDVVGLFDGS